MEVSNLSMGAAATKEFFVPVSGLAADTLAAKGDFPTRLINAAGEETHMAFIVPHDFNAIVSVLLIGIVEAADVDVADPMIAGLYTDYGALDQAYNAHSEQELSSHSLEGHSTIDDLISWNAAVVLTGIVVGDYVGFKVGHRGAFGGSNSTAAYIIGLRLKYN